MRDVMVLKDERSAVKAQVNALKVEELKLLAEQKRLKTSIEEVEYLLEQHTEQQREGDRVVTTLSNQIHELLNSFCDDQYPPQSNKRQYPEGDDEEPVMTRSRRGGRHV
jgi:chromosome segregation ATPase